MPSEKPSGLRRVSTAGDVAPVTHQNANSILIDIDAISQPFS
jgi:hypothetical protein